MSEPTEADIAELKKIYAKHWHIMPTIWTQSEWMKLRRILVDVLLAEYSIDFQDHLNAGLKDKKVLGIVCPDALAKLMKATANSRDVQCIHDLVKTYQGLDMQRNWRAEIERARKA